MPGNGRFRICCRDLHPAPMPRARDIALRAWPGKIVKRKREREAGGSSLRYSFDITRGKVIHEVGVDAKSGKLLEHSIESADSD